MPSVYFDYSNITDDARRGRVFDGNVFVYSPRPSLKALCDLAKSMLEAAFPHTDPQSAQFNMGVEEFVHVVSPLKSRFTNDQRTKDLVKGALADFGCDLDKTYFDVPRLRVVTHGDYLTAGVGYAYKPHRDIWYSSPASQINWWMPVYELEAERSLILYLDYWNRPVRNSSRDFDYGEWCRVGRQQAVSQVGSDTRKHPLPEEEISADGDLRLVCDAAAVICFSSAQLHATAPNTSGITRFSLDFRTVHLQDLQTRKGAQVIDCGASGSTLSDFIRASDFSGLPAELASVV